MARILAVDPGLTRCGYAVLDGDKPIEFGHFSSQAGEDPTDRVGSIAQALVDLCNRNNPELIALERVFANSNLRSVMGVAQISGALMAHAYSKAIPVEFFTPSEVKAAVTGNGRASKEQVGFMVAKQLGLDSVPKPADVADALAVAMCAQRRSQSFSTPARQKWVAAAKKARPRLG